MSNSPVTLAADDRATRFWLVAAAAFIVVQNLAGILVAPA